jgi:hypothetical protein
VAVPPGGAARAEYHRRDAFTVERKLSAGKAACWSASTRSSSRLASASWRRRFDSAARSRAWPAMTLANSAMGTKMTIAAQSSAVMGNRLPSASGWMNA